MACQFQIHNSLVGWNGVLTVYSKSPSIIHTMSHVAMSLKDMRRQHAHAAPTHGILVSLLVKLKLYNAVPLLHYHRLHMMMHHE